MDHKCKTDLTEENRNIMYRVTIENHRKHFNFKADAIKYILDKNCTVGNEVCLQPTS